MPTAGAVPRTARALGISRSTLWRRMREAGLDVASDR
ncbi:MAG: helix-turn-helix domain-containing protein [Vicinamibacterales bacterium]